jgi:hypothetical protein
MANNHTGAVGDGRHVKKIFHLSMYDLKTNFPTNELILDLLPKQACPRVRCTEPQRAMARDETPIKPSDAAMQGQLQPHKA